MIQATRKKKTDVRAMKMIKSMDMMRWVMGDEYRRLGMGMSIGLVFGLLIARSYFSFIEFLGIMSVFPIINRDLEVNLNP
jgi:hypothetical protein